uniref:Uncharacterized protein n=1 Tax=Heterorhabditis bacteriophora TaxID=37862 RepID=A0A1I7WS87_HETBA
MTFYPDEDFQPETTSSSSIDQELIGLSPSDRTCLPEIKKTIRIPRHSRCSSVYSVDQEQVNNEELSYSERNSNFDDVETEARYEKLRQIGESKSCPRNALRKYLVEKVATGLVPNPWISEPLSEISMKKTLRRFVKFMLVKACEDIGAEECGKPIILDFLTILFNLFMVNCNNNNNNNNNNVPTCSARNDYDIVNISADRRINYIILEGGAYSRQLEMPNQEVNSSTPKVSAIKSEKNTTDCEEIIEMIPCVVTKKLVSYYMGRYFSLWAFGDAAVWKSRGCTLFQFSVAGQD